MLAEAQADGAPQRRTAGRCALRGLRKADVAVGDCARLAATVSLVLAAAKIRDHADDGDGALGRPGVRGAATALAGRWAAASARTGEQLGFEVGVLTEAVGRQLAVEAAAGPGTALLTVTEPTETATAAAFAHTAVLAGAAGQPGAAGRGGAALRADRAPGGRGRGPGRRPPSGAWNPLLATGTDLAEARRLCDDALLGIRLALAETRFTDDRLVQALLVRELTRSVHRIFAPPPAADRARTAPPAQAAARARRVAWLRPARGRAGAVRPARAAPPTPVRAPAAAAARIPAASAAANAALKAAARPAVVPAADRKASVSQSGSAPWLPTLQSLVTAGKYGRNEVLLALSLRRATWTAVSRSSS